MKEGFLILSRARLDHMLIEAIGQLKERYAITVIADEESFARYAELDGVHVERAVTIADARRLRETAARPDLLEKLGRIENELGISTYEAHYNYLLYDIFVSRYAQVSAVHNDMKEFLPETVCLEYELIRRVVEERNVKYVYYETIDLSLSYLLNAYAKKFALQAYEFSFLPVMGEHRIRVSADTPRFSRRIEAIYKKRLYAQEDLQRAELALADMTKARTSYYDRFHKKSLLAKILKRLTTGPKRFNVKAFITRRRNAMLARRYFDSALPEEPFVAYFLQHTPEASMCSRAPLFVNQDVFIEQLAIYGKGGYKIVVKEHPKTLGNRPATFYSDLKSLPNVVLLPPDFDSRVVVERASAVIAVTSTALSLLSILKGKPVFAFTDTFISFFDHVIRVNSPKEFWQRFDVTRNQPLEREKIVAFLAACYRGSYEFPEGEGNSILPRQGGGAVLAKALMDEIDFANAQLTES